MSVEQIKSAIEQLSLEERAELAAWLRGEEGGKWEKQMKEDIPAGNLNLTRQEVDEEVNAGRLRDMP